MATICGNCGQTHQRVQEVKDCYAASAAERKPVKSKSGKVKAGSGNSATVAERGRVTSSFPERVVREGENKNWRQLKAGFYNCAGTKYKIRISGNTGLPYASIETRHGDGPEAKVTFEYKPEDTRKLFADMFIGERLPRDKKDKGQAINYDDANGDPESGMYRLNGPDGQTEILKIYKAVHGSGRMCAKRMIVVQPAMLDEDGKAVRNEDGSIMKPAVIDWQYLGLAVKYLSGHVKVTLDEASAWGEIYGVCMRCGKTLTLESSIAASLGTTCIKYFQNDAA